MRLIKIDLQKQAVESIECPGTLEDIYEIPDCQSFDVCTRQDIGYSLTVDDDSLSLDTHPPVFSFNDSGSIHDVALLTSTDDEGRCCGKYVSTGSVANKHLIYTKNRY